MSKCDEDGRADRRRAALLKLASPPLGDQVDSTSRLARRSRTRSVVVGELLEAESDLGSKSGRGRQAMTTRRSTPEAG